MFGMGTPHILIVQSLRKLLSFGALKHLLLLKLNQEIIIVYGVKPSKLIFNPIKIFVYAKEKY